VQSGTMLVCYQALLRQFERRGWLVWGEGEDGGEAGWE